MKDKNLKINKKKIKRISLVRLMTLVFVVIFLMFSMYAVTKKSLSMIVGVSGKVMQKYSQEKEDKKINDIQKVEKVEIENVILTKEQVMDKVKNIITLPKGEASLFIKVKDPMVLQKVSPMYNDLKKDDYLIAYPTLLVMYDAKEDKLIKTITLK